MNYEDFQKRLKSIEPIVEDDGVRLIFELADNDMTDEDFIPKDIDNPDVDRYICTWQGEINGEMFIEMRSLAGSVKQAKEHYGIVDPWDLEPEKYYEKWKNSGKNVQMQGIELTPENKNIDVEDFIPDNPLYPNTSRYRRIIYWIQNPEQKIELKENFIYTEELQIIELKKKLGIVDPWDLEPEKYRKKWEDYWKKNPKPQTVLEVNPLYKDIPDYEFIPEHFDYPDACRYNIVQFYPDAPEKKEIVQFSTIEEKDMAVKKMKKNLHINDSWNYNPEYWRKEWEEAKAKEKPSL